VKSRAAATTPGVAPAARGSLIAALSAVGSVFAASACCLPVWPLALAAGSAGGAAVLQALRIPLLAASVLFLGLGFVRSRKERQCHGRRSPWRLMVLWTSALIVAVSILLPQLFADLVARLL